MTRPQLIVPCFILGVLLLKWFRATANLSGIAWMIVVAALVMSPLLLAYGPAFPVNYAAHVIQIQGGNDPHASQFNYVSYDGYSVWPLVTGLFSGQVGKDRMYYPDSALLAGGLSYKQIATAAVVVAVIALAFAGLFMHRKTRLSGTFIALLASAMLALLMLDTGVSAQHFVIAIALLSMAITVIPATYYYPAVGALTVSTLVSMYGSFGYAVSASPSLAPRLFSGNNPVTQLFMERFVNDRFMTWAILLNLAILVLVVVATVTSYGGSRNAT